MALQGNLRDFSATEILQLLGSQKKTGCLTLDNAVRTMTVHVLDGRVVSTRAPGLTKDDPLLAFLRAAHRLSDEQHRGIQTIQRESGRDLEDLLLNGRYLDPEELAAFVERQILDDMMRLARWEEGTYRFDPQQRWGQPPLVRLSVEGILMEVARRADEQKRQATRFPDADRILGVRDLPDPDVELSEEERELFGIVDGRHTLAEIVAAAPLSEYETLEALHNMVEAGWLEVTGHRAAGGPPAPPGHGSWPRPRRSSPSSCCCASRPTSWCRRRPPRPRTCSPRRGCATCAPRSSCTGASTARSRRGSGTSRTPAGWPPGTCACTATTSATVPRTAARRTSCGSTPADARGVRPAGTGYATGSPLARIHSAASRSPSHTWSGASAASPAPSASSSSRP